MWFFIIAGMMLSVIAGLVYVSKKMNQLSFFKKVTKGRKKIGFWIAFCCIALLFTLMLFTIKMMNAMIVIIHLLVFWLFADLIYYLLNRKKDIKGSYDRAIALMLVLLLAYLGCGWFYAHHVFETDYQFTSDKVSKSLRVVQITDSHVGATFHWQGFEKHMQTVQTVNPDIVVITGDFVDDDTSKEDMIECCRILGQLKTTYGVYFVFGNHDKGYYASLRGYGAEELIAELEKNNVIVLQDQAVIIADQYCLIGRQDASAKGRATMQELMQKVDSNLYSIVLDHQPTDYDAQAGEQVDMVLSGHTHGGQLLPINYMGEWTGLNAQTYGRRTINQTNFIVSSGISDWAIKFKTGCIAEYVVIDITGK